MTGSDKSKKRKKKRPKKLFSPRTSTSSTSSNNTTKFNGLVIEALRGEAFGPHPGLVDVRLKLFLYNSIAQREIRLPGKQIDLLIGSPGEIDELLKVIRQAIKDWVMGYTIVPRE